MKNWKYTVELRGLNPANLDEYWWLRIKARNYKILLRTETYTGKSYAKRLGKRMAADLKGGIFVDATKGS